MILKSIFYYFRYILNLESFLNRSCSRKPNSNSSETITVQYCSFTFLVMSAVIISRENLRYWKVIYHWNRNFAFCNMIYINYRSLKDMLKKKSNTFLIMGVFIRLVVLQWYRKQKACVLYVSLTLYPAGRKI